MVLVMRVLKMLPFLKRRSEIDSDFDSELGLTIVAVVVLDFVGLELSNLSYG